MSGQFDDYYGFRSKLIEEVRTDLVGPGEEREIITDAPITQYISGILYPQSNSAIDPEQDVDEEDDYDESALPDPPVAMANTRYPSSMGLTFSVDSGVTGSCVVSIEATRYLELEDEVGEEENAAEEVRDGSEGSLEQETSEDAKPEEEAISRARRKFAARWQREPLTIDPVKIPISKPLPNYRFQVADGLELFCRVRSADDRGRVPVTLALVNKHVVKQGLKDAYAFFQPRLKVSSPIDGEPCFVDRPPIGLPASDEDLRSYSLLYRHSHNFAVGHGCSVQWDAHVQEGSVSSIWTEFVPEYELWLSDSNPAIESEALDLKFLLEADRGSVVSALEGLCGGYSAWIDERNAEVSSLDSSLQEIAETHLASCRTAYKRMLQGVRLLADDDDAWTAFRLANEAMLEQRSRSDWIKGGKQTKEPDRSPHQAWRPFQIAFILLCLPGIQNPKDASRDFADLLWFPTGGGKTEAYLGLIAFTVFLRRLRSSDAAGVTVLMRYTLRLLTIQQFERAAMLICSCEAIRSKRSDLGPEPFSIGLWVGEGGTPNSVRTAEMSLDKLRQGIEPEEANPVQLHTCPWCGNRLDHKNYYVTSSVPKRLVVSCRNNDCFFVSGLPVYLVDEEIYRVAPSLIISTVDKFASLPWNPGVGALFNLDTNRPSPELIIQDELHLISGPLGTLTGLYETAIDYLCSKGGTRPKVIASTATIRRAGQQTEGLFARELRQFPPPGLDARNSYFAVETTPAEKGTRTYLGLMAPGTSQTTLMVRAYAALLQNAQDETADPKVRDPYWTLVGYFNSLRVLGGARMQVQDDVRDRMSLLATNNKTEPRPLDNVKELTSRVSSGSIPDLLFQMAIEHPEEDALDVILATNMISVGVDIDRLGLMAVMGQPQSTSEYIQSTSRVGRRYPGLVLVLLNASRSRDRSHYESFSAFHSALYRQVESTSVTPFSARARDRGLHSILIALCRLLIPKLAPNDGAKDLAAVETEIVRIKQVIMDRVERIAPEELGAAEKQIDEILEQWAELIGSRPNLVYSNYRYPEKALLVDAGRDQGEEGFETTRSLRDVDMASNLFLVRG